MAEPGLGKTALLNAAAEAADATGARVLRAGGNEFEADLPFSGLNQALLPIAGDLSTLADQHGDVLAVSLGLEPGPPPGRLRACNAVLGLLRSLAEISPVIVIVDDLQWLDRLSTEVLSFAGRRLDGSPVGLLAASRSGAQTLVDRVGWPVHELEPLDDPAARELLETRFPALTPRVRMRLLAEAAGNPLALLELPASLSERERQAVQALPPVLPLSRRLEALFAARIVALPAVTRSLLLLAVLDGSGDLGILQAQTGDEELRDLQPAEQAELVRVDARSGQLKFRHPLIRSAVVQSADRTERRQSHVVLAKLTGHDPDRRAWHLAEAATAPDEHVAALLEAAASRAEASGDPVGAGRKLTRAAELSPRPVDRRRRQAEAALLDTSISGDLENAARLLAAPAGSPDDSRQLLQAASAEAFLQLNSDVEIDAGVRMLADAIKAAGDQLPASNDAVITAIRMLSLLCYFAGRAEPWHEWEAIVSRLTPEIPDDLYLLSTTLPDPVRTAGPVARQFDATVATLHNETHLWRVRAVTFAAVHIDRLTACRPAVVRHLRRARQTGAGHVVVTALLDLCMDDFSSGRWQQLQSELSACIAACHDYDLRMYLPIAQYCQGLLAAVRGDDELACDLAEHISRWAEPRRASLLADASERVRGLAAISRGDFEAAYQHAAAISSPGTFPSYHRIAPWVCFDLVEAATCTGRNAEAAAHAAAIDAAGVTGISDRLRLLATGSAAMAAADDDVALSLFEGALATPNATRWPFDRARVQLAYGERLRRARSSAAAAQLVEARDTFRRLQARPWARRASQQIRAVGYATPGTSVAETAASLSPQQRTIARMAAAGMTNREIGQQLYLSPRTVSTHL